MSLPETSADDLPTLRQRLAYIATLPGIAHSIYPTLSPFRRFKKTAIFCINGARNQTQLKQLQAIFDCPELAGVLNAFPAILEKPFSTYLNVRWSLNDRLQQLRGHFNFLKEALGENSVEIYKPEGYRLFQFKTNEDELFSVELFQGYQCEGAMGLRLCDAENREFYALSFQLSSQPHKAIHIGALQGPNDRIPERQKKIVTLTRSLHGLRPKALMIEVIYMLAKNLGVSRVYAIANDSNIYQCERVSDAQRSLIAFDLDELLGEYGATRGDSEFYELPQTVTRKDIAMIKSKKRGLYRKRYVWLDGAEALTQGSVSALLLKN